MEGMYGGYEVAANKDPIRGDTADEQEKEVINIKTNRTPTKPPASGRWYSPHQTLSAAATTDEAQT